MIDMIVSAIIFLLYGCICLLSLIFTFSIETYNRLEELLNSILFSGGNLSTVLDKKVDWLNVWVKDRNKLFGPLLLLLSVFDLISTLKIISILKSSV